jgi:hypothetical protein
MEAVFNRHSRDFSGLVFTIEFNVKFPNLPQISEEDWEFEYSTGHFTNEWAEECFKKIAKLCRSKRWSLNDWSFAGRSNGWFALLCDGDSTAVTERQLTCIEEIVEDYFKRYGVELGKCYPQEVE